VKLRRKQFLSANGNVTEGMFSPPALKGLLVSGVAFSHENITGITDSTTLLNTIDSEGALAHELPVDDLSSGTVTVMYSVCTQTEGEKPRAVFSI